MKKINILYMEYILFTSIVWCIFSESFSLLNILTGVVLGAGLFKLSIGFLKEKGLSRGNHGNISIGLYLIYLMGEVYKNTLGLIKLILANELNPVIMEVETRAEGRVASIVANSITLTPKTASIDKKGSCITVLCAHPMKEEDVVEGFERRLLMKGEQTPAECLSEEV